MGFFVKRNTYIPTITLTQFIVEHYVKELLKNYPEYVPMTDAQIEKLYDIMKIAVDNSLVDLEHFLEHADRMNIDLRGL